MILNHDWFEVWKEAAGFLIEVPIDISLEKLKETSKGLSGGNRNFTVKKYEFWPLNCSYRFNAIKTANILSVHYVCNVCNFI
jgi:hypothetical protein